jgi:hypothetical protein
MQRATPRQIVARLPWAAAVIALASAGCRDRQPVLPLPDDEPTAAPDRLGPGESLPEAETAFGLVVPRGMRITRYFNDSVYVSGSVPLQDTIEHVQGLVVASNVEITTRSAVFRRVRIKGDRQNRLFRIEIQGNRHESEFRLRNVTPPPLTPGLTEAERWKQAGRNPDGSLIDENQVF